MGGHSSKDKRGGHVRLKLLRRLLQWDSEETSNFTTHGICYWPGKPVRFKHRRKLIRMINEQSTATAVFPPLSTTLHGSHQSLLAAEGPPPSLERTPTVFPFENLVLSGGGMRGYAYIGAIQAMADMGILDNLKRYAGASAGAMCATVLALGYNAQDMAKCFYVDLSETFKDQDCASVACVPKMLMLYGVHPAKRYYDCLGICIENKTGNADLTFQQYHDLTGKEICIVVSNVTKLRTEYCHHTTTPRLPIRMAVRMSMAVPFLYEPVKCDVTMSGNKKNRQVYVDGSLGDHFPIHCFDGDSVGLNEEGPINNKTIGCYLVSEKDSDHLLWSYIFDKKLPLPSYLPNTRCARSQIKEEIKRRKKMHPDFSSKDFLNELYTSSENLYRHYEAPRKTGVATDNILDVIVTNLECILHNQVIFRLRAEDEARTVAINTGYIKSHDYDIEPADREFMINQGYENTLDFLKNYKIKHTPWRMFCKESNV